MRLLHTSDWHLGRQFHQSSLLEEQAAAVDAMVELAASERVDAVLIAGDLFDRAIPSTWAVDLFDDALVRLRDTGAVVVAITGNHDSASRAGFGDRLLTRAGVTVRSDPARLADPVVVTDARSGDDSGAVAVYPVPFLDPLSVPRPLHDGPADDPDDADDLPSPRRRPTHHSVMADAMDRIARDRRRRGLRSVVVAHAFVANFTPRLDEPPVEESDSERALAVGGSDRVDQSVFDHVDYVALGHLHGPQSWDDGRITYSGSPLAYSFSEQHHRKGWRIVDPDRRWSARTSLMSSWGSVGVSPRSLGTSRTSSVVPSTRTRRRCGSVPCSPTACQAGPWPACASASRSSPSCSTSPRSARCRTTPSSVQIRRRRPLDLAVEFVTEQWVIAPDAAASGVLRRAVTAVASGPTRPLRLEIQAFGPYAGPG